MRIFYIISALIFTIGPISQAQVPNDKYLEIVDYEELLTLFNVYEGDSLVQKKIIDTYLSRAKEDNDTIKIARSFDRLARIFSSKKNISYADSLIDYTRDWKHITYPAIGYIIQGYEFGVLGEINESYNKYLRANQIAQLNQNLTQQVYILDRLIFLKVAFGDKEKALKMQEDRDFIVNSKMFEKSYAASSRIGVNDQISSFITEQKILSVEGFILCHLALKNYEKAFLYLSKHDELLMNLDRNKEDAFIWGMDAKMEFHYYNKNYEAVLESALELEELSVNYGDDYYLLNSYLFHGLTSVSQNNWLEAKKYLTQAEELDLINNNRFMPESKVLLFEALKRVSEHENDPEGQIYYLDKLIELDNLRLENYIALEPQFIRTFETPRLIKSKEDIINALQLRNTQSYVVIGISVFLFLFFSALSYYFFRQKVTYRRRFEKLMKDDNSHSANKSKSLNNEAPIIISNDIVTDILKRLKRFEDNEDFLKDNVTLIALAKKMHTNSSYLSRVVNSHKLKSFSQYLNDLRVQYAVSKIKSDHVFRRYTVEAIASECGYNTAASFSRSFYKKTGIYPSFMIAEVNKQGGN